MLRNELTSAENKTEESSEKQDLEIVLVTYGSEFVTEDLKRAYLHG
jgi:hypothetical protein